MLETIYNLLTGTLIFLLFHFIFGIFRKLYRIYQI